MPPASPATTSTPRAAASLEVLPSELVVMVAGSLDISSSLALASTSTSLRTILTTTTEWTKLCNQICKRRASQEVAQLTSFLGSVQEPEQLFATLFHCLCSQFPSWTDAITITCSLHQHQVSPLGMHLLHLATSAVAALPRNITGVVANNLDPGLPA